MYEHTSESHNVSKKNCSGRKQIGNGLGPEGFRLILVASVLGFFFVLGRFSIVSLFAQKMLQLILGHGGKGIHIFALIAILDFPLSALGLLLGFLSQFALRLFLFVLELCLFLRFF